MPLDGQKKARHQEILKKKKNKKFKKLCSRPENYNNSYFVGTVYGAKESLAKICSQELYCSS